MDSNDDSFKIFEVQSLNYILLEMYFSSTSFLGEMQRIAFSPMLSSCVCASVCVCVCVCMPRLWTSGKRFEIETSFFLIARNNTAHTCKSFTQIGLQIPRWRTKWRP